MSFSSFVKWATFDFYLVQAQDFKNFLRRDLKLMLARWRSQPIRKGLSNLQPITERLQRISLKFRLSSNAKMNQCDWVEFRVLKMDEMRPLLKLLQYKIKLFSFFRITDFDIEKNNLWPFIVDAKTQMSAKIRNLNQNQVFMRKTESKWQIVSDLMNNENLGDRIILLLWLVPVLQPVMYRTCLLTARLSEP